MSIRRILAVAIAALFLSASLAAAQEVTSTTSDSGVTQPPVYGVYGPMPRSIPGTDLVPLPEPAIPSPLIATGQIEFVGITEPLYRGDKGVLNLTLACQRTFPGSRMCSAKEINATINVPQINRFGYAWVLPNDPLQSLVSQHISADLNCEGWMTSASDKFGFALAIDSSVDCYGGYVTKPCSSQLAVACCASVEVD